MIDLANKRSENFRIEINAMADYAIHTLRSPYTDGSGYRFAEVKFPKDDIPETIADAKIIEIFDSGKKQNMTGEARVTNALHINLPKYRSGGLFKNNGDAYIYSYTVDYTIDGKKYTIAKEYKNWQPRATAIDIPLPGIAEWAKISTDIAVKPSDYDKTYVELTATHPEIKDDPANPFSYSIDVLQSVIKNVAYAKPDELVKILKEADRGIDAVPAAIGANLPPENQIAQKIDAVLQLLDSNDTDKAKDALKSLSDSLK